MAGYIGNKETASSASKSAETEEAAPIVVVESSNSGSDSTHSSSSGAIPEGEYEVEALLDAKEDVYMNKPTVKVQVKWVNSDDITWEPFWVLLRGSARKMLLDFKKYDEVKRLFDVKYPKTGGRGGPRKKRKRAPAAAVGSDSSSSEDVGPSRGPLPGLQRENSGGNGRRKRKLTVAAAANVAGHY